MKEVETKRYMDASLDAKIRAQLLLDEMSVEEKMSQIRCFMPRDMSDVKKLKDVHPLGAGNISCLSLRFADSPDQAAAWINDLQKETMALSPHHIPAVFHMEGLCGCQVQGDLSLPSGLSRGASFDPALEEQLGKVVARQETALGITQILAPVLDVAHDPRMGRMNETEGEDPALIAALGTAFVKGIQSVETDGKKAESVAKHFLGFHASEAGIHGANVPISQREIREIYAKPFQAAITEGGLKGIMPCYCTINEEPLHGSKDLLTHLLREEMHFDGQVVSDYSGNNNMHRFQGIGESYSDAGIRALEAGVDVELPNKETYDDEVERRFKNGEADIDVLDQAVLRVLTAKFRMGMFEHPFALEGESLHAVYDVTEGDRKLTLQSARESIVLLKNENKTLPLEKDTRRITVIGSEAKSARIFFGGYTHFSMSEGLLASIQTMAGVDHGDRQNEQVETIPGTLVQRTDNDPQFEALLQKQKPGIKGLLAELEERMPETEINHAFGYYFFGEDESYFEDALKKSEDADVVIMVLGGKNGTSMIASMGEGIDGTNVNLPKAQEELIRLLGEQGKTIIGVHVDGRPISSDMADKYCAALLECWVPSEAGAEAIVDVLTGKVNPSGKMPVSTVYNAGQIPLQYNYKNGSSMGQGDSIGFTNYVDCTHAPRYCFGEGLSYTTFAYSDLVIQTYDKDGTRQEDKKVQPDGRIEVSFQVKNTGEVFGTETAQLYVKDPYAGMVRLNKELAGFARVDLQPKEEKTVVMTMRPDQFAYLNKDMQWLVEKGELQIMIGTSSKDIALRDSCYVMESRIVEGYQRGFFAKVEVRS